MKKPQTQNTPKRRIFQISFLVLLFLFIFGGMIARFYTDWLWFGEVGYTSVFWTKIINKLVLGVIGGLLFFIIVYTNLWIARRMAPPVISNIHDESFRGKAGRLAKRAFALIILGIAIAVGVLAGIEASSHWLDYKVFANAVMFNQQDPIFKKDISFYVFKLGFYRYIYGWLFFTLSVAFIGTALVHYTDRAIEFLSGKAIFAPHVKSHLSLIFAAVLFVRAWGFRLDAYSLLYSPSGVIYGAGYTDVHARLLGYQILTVAAVIAGILGLINIYRKGIKLPVAAIAILFGAYIIFGAVYPSFIQQFIVKPNELNKESSFIQNNIDLTRQAFNLDKIETRSFPKLAPLSADDIKNNSATIKSIRLWDYRPLQSTYSQLQSLWQYYSILNVDIDRYRVDGIERQVMLAAREMSSEAGQTGSGTWVNRHFQFTHGYGAVMSPVNEKTEKGLPNFFIKDMPPKSSVGINITRPEIYYGELTHDFVVANSSEKEFDYPSEGKPTYTSYSGKGGISISGYLQRLAFAWRFSDINLILKNPISPGSRMMMRRQIVERVNTIFPFMMYDSDPYLVISNGKLFWMIDAYTVSNSYPYSTPYEISPGSGFNTSYYATVNYMRNSAKVVIDAYEGTVNYYVSDDTDPMVKTYSKVFPGVFKQMSEMPSDIHEHIRYPEMMFRLQSQVLFTYHMQDPQVFYNKSDRWDTPNELVDVTGEETPMEPYYVVMRLPGQKHEQFLLMRPFVQAQKNNMVAWMGAICDPENYGKILLYQFPKDELVYGPAQIESTINQDPDISPKLNLWNQLGTKVNRGNMIVIPIEKSILYVKPLYLQSTTSKIPELSQVVVAYQDKVAMESTLEAALQRVFGSAGSQPVASDGTRQPSAKVSAPQDIQGLINQAGAQFDAAQKSQRDGDWAGYGAQVKQLESTLKQLKKLTRGK